MMALFSWLRRQVWPVAYKEFIHMINDPTTVRVAILLPLIQMTIFGFAINMEIKDVPTVVFNEDLRPNATELLQKLQNTTYFRINKTVFSKQALIETIQRGEAQVGIVIPPDYSNNLALGRQAAFQVLIDGSESNTANQTLATAMQLGSILSQDAQSRQNLGSFTPPTRVQPVPYMMYNPDLKTTFLTIPGLLAIVLMNVTVMLTTFSIVKEKECGTMEQLLVTPLMPSGLMVGKILPYILLGILDFNIVLLAMILIFKVPIRGNLALLEGCAFIFLMSTLGMGLLISARCTNQTQAGQVSQLMILPAILLSGFVFQIQAMPPIIQWLSYLMPATYFIEILRGIILRGASFQELALPIGYLTVIGFAILGSSILAFRRQTTGK